MADVITMDDLFLDELRDLYDAEKQITKALPKMMKAAHAVELKNAFDEHLQQTENHVTRLEQIFATLKSKPAGEKCDAMQGLVKEGEKMIANTDEGYVRDAGLIAAAQRVEHYEMAGYGSAKSFAQILGHSDAVSLLNQTLQEEELTDRKLTKLADGLVNKKASGAGTMHAHKNV